MNGLLIQHGFTFDGTCQCDGKLTEKYRKGEYQVRIRVRTNQFKLKHSGRSMTQWVPLAKLQESLENVIANVAA